MAEEKNVPVQSPVVKREEEILAFWKENDIFRKSLEKESPKGTFVFFDGPPFATGLPHYGHVLPGTIKDVVPRYKTMQGYRVPRRWGWDCHGLPIENLIEKELGLSSRKDIEVYGIEKFNDAAKASVLRYDHDWRDIIPRTGRFVDMEQAYLTMDWKYSESIWWSFKTLYDKKLVYEGFKSMMLCPRCETTLSNFEVSQGYKDITDISVYVTFGLTDEPGTSMLAWTTTPWTLPGNAALAVNPGIAYVKVECEKRVLVLAKDRLAALKDKEYKIVAEFLGKELVGRKYKPLFDYYAHRHDLAHKENGWKVVAADFVTTTDGTGVVHIAPAFGEDDYALSLKEKLPFIQHVAQDGTFKKEVTWFAGMQVKPKSSQEEPNAHQKADVEIIKYLAAEGNLFAKEKIIHSYPHCWRCDTPLLNYATSSWFVKVTDLKDTLVAENNSVSWVPPEIGIGRFGKWLENARDWAISRSRYWGAPLPVWRCDECGATEIVGSVEDIRRRTKRNTYHVVRHGEADHNILNILSSDPKTPHHLTDHGREQVTLTAQALKDKKIDLIVTSPMVRTKETVDVLVEQLAYKGPVEEDARLSEFNFGEYNLKNFELYYTYFNSVKERLTKRLPGGENLNDLRVRAGEFLYELDAKHEGKTIVIVTHDGPATALFAVAEGADDKRMLELWGLDRDFLSPGQESLLDFASIPHDRMYALNVHRPYVDDMTFMCSCRGTLRRVNEVFDTWYESGSMPYASVHYPFENKKRFDSGELFPADIIAEGQDQTRGWFYSLLVLSVALFGRAPFKNVVVNGTVLAEDGQKMSKRLKNYPELSAIINRYGADALRYYLMSSPAVHAEDLAFTEKGVDEVYKKILLRLMNVYSFYETYTSDDDTAGFLDVANVLDRWILARLGELVRDVTGGLERYEIDRAAKPIAQFVDDLSTWYLRRSRDRFKGDDAHDRQSALQTTRIVLFELSKILAPFMPFAAEDLYQKVRLSSDLESVHLEVWPKDRAIDADALASMEHVRRAVTLALEARAKANLKIRQPLSRLELNEKVFTFAPAYTAIVKDEVNVKNVVMADLGEESVALDTTLTPELTREGRARELIRALQELRKSMKLNPSDSVALSVETDSVGKDVIETHRKDVCDTVQIASITYESVDGEMIEIDDLAFTVALKKV